MTDELEDLRKQINHLNSEIVKLLDERMNVSREIGAIKKKKGLNIFDEVREKMILEEVSSKSEYPEHMREIFQKIMDEAKRLQE